ncbi:MAG TPA: GNAT family N-acetyltransferase [Thermaerobacter sp.]
MEIRLLRDNRELEAAERLQQVVWGGPSLVPAATMRATLEVGGCVIGAWDGDRLIGFCFGFPGWRERQPLPPGIQRLGLAGGEPAGAGSGPGGAAGRGPGGNAGPGQPAQGPAHATVEPPVPAAGAPREPVLHSDLLAVDPGYRDRGIGRRLKWAQRRWALEQGLYLITWTYDPLQTRNGFLNLTRLGGVGRRYVREFYSTLDDELNRGLPADRVVIEWYLDSDRVSHRAAAAGVEPVVAPEPQGAPRSSGATAAGAILPAANRVRPGEGAEGLPEPAGWQLLEGEPAVVVEVPARFADWRAGRPDWALRWRFHLREVLEAYLAAGYLLDACEPLRPGAATTRYILRRRAAVEAPA